MADMLDYLDWRGDVPFSVSPFNEVDNLILATLAYTDFDGIVPDSGEALPLSAVHEAYFSTHSREALIADGSFLSRAALLLDRLITGPRFGGMKLCYYINEIDADRIEQLSAVSFLLDNGAAYVAFRGTDSTLTGWKEDFNLSYLRATAGQERAAAYLKRVADALPCPLYVGGHSKGANFAVYASTRCEAPDRLLAIYSNDGPGFRREFVESEAYLRILPKIVRIVPETPVIGSLLYASAKPRVVKSSASGIYQHDGFSWAVERSGFVETALSETGKIIDRTLKDWLEGMDDETRRFFTETVFAFFESTGKDSFSDIRIQKLKSAESMLGYLRALPKEKQSELLRLAGQLIQSGGQAALAQLPELLFGKGADNP